jgi:hypothetical protein
MNPTLWRKKRDAARKAKGVCVECVAVLPDAKYVRCVNCREQRAQFASLIDRSKPEPEPCSYAATIPCRGCHKTFKSTDRRSVRLCDACRYHWYRDPIADEFLYMV